MNTSSVLIDSVYKEIKRKGMFGRKNIVSLSVYTDKIKGNGFKKINESLTYSSFTLPYNTIKEIAIVSEEGEQCLSFTYRNTVSLSSNATATIIMLGLDDPRKWKTAIENAKNKAEENARQEQETRKKQENKLRQIEQDKATFYQSCYDYHIKAETPVYVFSSEKNAITTMYVSADKSLNFLYINGNTSEESVGTIPYAQIHYFDKAGNISYATDIHGSYSSFGGSMTGGSFSKATSVIGGALFGLMGMTAGALLTYKPSKQEPLNTSFKLDSEIVKIDDRSVILNFFSDERKQYVDIELPQDTYNFLQTHLPEKKHGVVEELEKHAALQKANEQKAISPAPNTGLLTDASSSTAPDGDDSMAAFKRKVEKLKIMKEAGLLTAEEFEEEKRKLIASL